ncbi:MAG: CDP-alcohol phosphatidyltransferase family protein [Tannerella sp.]|nr:CDP-alcohol phosphatidyltransferase family protein [Tannerella sp.]
MNLRKHIPNALTCANLLCGCYACILALSGHYFGAMIAIFTASGFDFLDGMAARLLKVCSPIGKDLDSLADLVSFGVAPGMLLFDFMDRMQKTAEWSPPVCGKLFLLAAGAIPVFSALRLARFNNDTRQSTHFIGLPVPAHAIFWASLLYIITPFASAAVYAGGLAGKIPVSSLLEIPPVYVLTVAALLAIGSSLLLVSNISMFSLKIKSLGWKGNELRYLFLAAAIVLMVCLGFSGITVSILLYILLSIFNKHT